jgi:hypothetical protein
MQAEIGRDGASSLEVSVFTREEGMSEYYKPGVVYQGHPHDDEYPEMEFTPAQARELAAALLRAADEAEGRTGTDMSAEEIVVRSKVADELEALPRYNDNADWCAHIGYRQAVDTARRGRRRTLST